MEYVTLEGELLWMRPLEIGDIGEILELVDDNDIVKNTFVPHPYSAEVAREFVEQAREHWRWDEGFTFAINDRLTGQFAGCMGIHPKPKHNRAQVGYWIGKGYRGRGLATAALRLIIQFGFEQLGLHRIEAGHFTYNPASGRVMQKAGMLYEGLRRESALHREQYKDVIWYAILRGDYDADRDKSNSTKNKKTAED